MGEGSETQSGWSDRRNRLIQYTLKEPLESFVKDCIMSASIYFCCALTSVILLATSNSSDFLDCS